MHSEHAIGFSISKDFDKPLGCQIHFCAAVRGEGKLADIVGDARGLQLFLGFPDRGDFGIRVDDVWYGIVIDVARLPDQNFRNRYTLVFRLVSQHWTRDHIADSPDARNVGRIVVINDHTRAFVQLHAKFFETEALGVRHAANRDQNDISLDRFSSAALRRFHDCLEPFSGRIDRSDFGGQFECHALLLEQALRLTPYFAVQPGQRTVKKFHHRHLSSKTPPDRAKLKSDDAGPDDKQMLGHRRQRQSACRRDNALLVDFDAFQPRNVGAGSDDDGLGFDSLCLATLVFYFDLAWRNDAAAAEKRVDF